MQKPKSDANPYGGALSNMQMETVVYAGMRHATQLPNGTTAGFFLGDGVGLGKGRQLAGIILDNWLGLGLGLGLGVGLGFTLTLTLTVP